MKPGDYVMIDDDLGIVLACDGEHGFVLWADRTLTFEWDGHITAASEEDMPSQFIDLASMLCKPQANTDTDTRLAALEAQVQRLLERDVEHHAALVRICRGEPKDLPVGRLSFNLRGPNWSICDWHPEGYGWHVDGGTPSNGQTLTIVEAVEQIRKAGGVTP